MAKVKIAETASAKMIDQNGRVLSPFLETISNNEEFGFENFHVLDIIDRIARGFFALSDMDWNAPCLKEYNTFLKQGIPEDIARESLKPWYFYHGILLPADLTDFAKIAKAFEGFLSVSRGGKFFSRAPEGPAKKRVLRELIANLRELQRIAYGDMSQNFDISLNYAIEQLSVAKFDSDYDSVCLAFQEFQMNALCQSIDWHLITECFRAAM